MPSHVVERMAESERQAIQARLEHAAELGRIERERQALTRSILDLSGDLAAAKRERPAPTLDRKPAPAAPSQNLSLEERLRQRVNERAEQLQGEWASEREREAQRKTLEREQNLERDKELEKHVLP